MSLLHNLTVKIPQMHLKYMVLPAYIYLDPRPQMNGRKVYMHIDLLKMYAIEIDLNTLAILEFKIKMLLLLCVVGAGSAWTCKPSMHVYSARDQTHVYTS